MHHLQVQVRNILLTRSSSHRYNEAAAKEMIPKESSVQYSRGRTLLLQERKKGRKTERERERERERRRTHGGMHGNERQRARPRFARAPHSSAAQERKRDLRERAQQSARTAQRDSWLWPSH